MPRFSESAKAGPDKINYPIKIIETITNCDNFDEDKYVKIYASKYGIDNVRDGSYSKIYLDNDHKKLLNNELRVACLWKIGKTKKICSFI